MKLLFWVDMFWLCMAFLFVLVAFAELVDNYLYMRRIRRNNYCGCEKCEKERGNLQ